MNHPPTYILQHFFWILVSVTPFLMVPFPNSHTIGYASSDILRKPAATMSTTIRVPAQVEDTPNAESVPFKRAYDRAKEFLKQILRKDVEWAHRSPENLKSAHRLIQENKTVDLINKFRQQLLAYA